MDWFHNEQACLDYLERLRWPKEFICPKCGVIGAAVKTSRNRLLVSAQLTAPYRPEVNSVMLVST